MNDFSLFKLMYNILDALNDENHNEALDTYLSEINPYIWKDSSGDPSYFNSFKNYLAKYGKDDYGYNAIKAFLDDEDYYKGVNKVFETLSKDEYIYNVKEIIKENISEFN